MSIMSDIAKNELYYKGKKPIQLTLDPASFVGGDGELNVDALCHEVMRWFDIQTAKIDAAEEAAENKKDG